MGACRHSCWHRRPFFFIHKSFIHTHSKSFLRTQTSHTHTQIFLHTWVFLLQYCPISKHQCLHRWQQITRFTPSGCHGDGRRPEENWLRKLTGPKWCVNCAAEQMDRTAASSWMRWEGGRGQSPVMFPGLVIHRISSIIAEILQLGTLDKSEKSVFTFVLGKNWCNNLLISLLETVRKEGNARS